MRRYATLRKVLGNLVFASLPVLPVACQCPDPIERTVYVRQMDAMTQQLLADCRASEAECLPLCVKMGEAIEGYADEYSFSTCEYVEDDEWGGGVHYVYNVECVGGRRPEGFRYAGGPHAASPRGGAARARSRPVEAGAWFARLHQLEAASVHAFAQLARELGAHGAPARLQRAARRAIGEERRHAAVTALLARRHGATPQAPVVAPARERTLAEVAEDNAAEGCVRETFGALVAAFQARAAADPVVRAAMRGIAADETRHAALSHDLDAWARRRLPAPARRRMEEARRAAVVSLCAEVDAEMPAALTRVAGLPDRATGRALLARAERELFAS